MKQKFIIALTALALTSCDKEVTPITFINGNVYRLSGDTTVKVNYPSVEKAANKGVADSINIFIKDLMSQMPTFGEPDPKASGDTINFPVEVYMNWSASQNSKIVQLEIEQYIFTGGAHGSTLLQTHTFDASNGRRIDPLTYITDKQKMLEIIHEQLSADSIPLLGSVADVPLPQFLALDSTAVTAIYNQYDIAPYSSGVIKIRMPYTQLEGIFDSSALDATTLSTTLCPTE